MQLGLASSRGAMMTEPDGRRRLLTALRLHYAITGAATPVGSGDGLSEYDARGGNAASAKFRGTAGRHMRAKMPSHEINEYHRSDCSVYGAFAIYGRDYQITIIVCVRCHHLSLLRCRTRSTMED